MGKKMGIKLINEPVWLSYDLGMGGDYEGLYRWLDSKKALECGDSGAFFHFSYVNDLEKEMKKELEDNVDFKKKGRIYITYMRKDGKIAGKFIFGGRKAAPWAGYAFEEQVDMKAGDM